MKICFFGCFFLISFLNHNRPKNFQDQAQDPKACRAIVQVPKAKKAKKNQHIIIMIGLSREGFACGSIHGDRSQGQREQVFVFFNVEVFVIFSVL